MRNQKQNQQRTFYIKMKGFKKSSYTLNL